MSIYCNRFLEKINYASAAVAFLFLFIFCSHAYSGQFDIGTKIITIVLDPGHGGETDFGAKGNDGKLEKDVTLMLAKMIAASLENRFNVILTRTEDTELYIPARTAVANHFKADLFISIHAGGDFVHKTMGISVFSFSDDYREVAGTDIVQAKPLENSKLPLTWEIIQKKYEQLSNYFAIIVKKNLSGIISNGDIRISSANYAVLEGADMPAILIETGYLTNTVDEKALSGKEYPADIVKGLSLAIDEYFQNIGLQEKIKHGN